MTTTTTTNALAGTTAAGVTAPAPVTAASQRAARGDFRFLEPMRVRWAEVDMQKIVFNGHYLMYFDTAVAGYWRALALPYEDTLHALGGDLYVRKAALEYEASARYDDRIDVGLRCERIGTSSIVLRGAVFRGTQRLVVGELVYVFADPVTQTSRPVPVALRDWLEAYEAGAPMLALSTGDWTSLGAEAAPLRRAVFGDELGLGAGFDGDADDVRATHVVACNRLGRCVGTGRVRIDGDAGGVAQIARVAVPALLRGAGIGAALLDALMAAARAAGAGSVELDAQADAVGFYRRHGFVEVGEVVAHGGLPHQRLRRTLASG